MVSFGEKVPLDLQFRANIMRGVFALLFLLIGVRLWYLQIVRGEHFRDKSENNRRQTVFVPPPRGIIKDRHGKVLVNNRPSFNIELIKEDSPDVQATLKALGETLELDAKELAKGLRNQVQRRKFEPKLLLKDVSREVVAKVSVAMHKLPGVIITVAPSRRYLYNDFAAHVIGYTREITGKQLESPRYPNYRGGDVVGQFGVEAHWERYLQGARGRKQVIVNATGTRVGELSYEHEVQGSTLFLTLDETVQRAADKALEHQRGAIVALDSRNGEIIALSSSERFDPNIFTGGLSEEQWQDLVKGKKLTDRAVQGAYPPGSVFKILTALAALSEGVITPKEKIECPGYYFYGGRRFGCWRKSGHGHVNLRKSLVQSCDVYYYVLGQRLGVDRIYAYATKLGLGRKAGIALPDEAQGLIPSKRWKRRAHRRPEDKQWYAGETLSVAIGQGAVSVTPLQVARMVAALVNGGKHFRPRLVRKVVSPKGRLIIDRTVPELVEQINLDQELVGLIRDALVGVVNEPGGTARRARLDPLLETVVAGKTGTAQVASLKFGTEGKLNDHGWFAGFAPAEDPELVVVALAENGGHGGSVAAPLVQKVMSAYFSAKKGIVLPVAPEEQVPAQ